MRPRVLLTDTVDPSTEVIRRLLARAGADLAVSRNADEATLVKEVAGAVAVMVVFAPITRAVIAAAAASDCKIIVRCGVGVDNIDLEAAAHYQIPVSNIPDYCTDEVADHTLALLLAAARDLVGAVEGVRGGSWNPRRTPIHRLGGARLALIGYGRIGRKVARRARGFGMKITVYDPLIDAGRRGTIQAVGSIEEAVKDADYVSLHTPLTPATRQLINRRSLAQMTRTPVLINTARGALVDADAVLEALDAGKLSGVAFDVTEIEPLPIDHRLRSHPRALLTPHMAFYSVEADENLKQRAVLEVVRAMRGRRLRSPVTQT